MDVSVALNELEELAKKLEVDVVYDHFTGDGMSGGGLCKVKGRWRVIVERQGSPGEKASVLARALARFDLEPHDLSPAVREFVHRTSGQETASTEDGEGEAGGPAEPPAC